MWKYRSTYTHIHTYDPIVPLLCLKGEGYPAHPPSISPVFSHTVLCTPIPQTLFRAFLKPIQLTGKIAESYTPAFCCGGIREVGSRNVSTAKEVGPFPHGSSEQVGWAAGVSETHSQLLGRLRNICQMRLLSCGFEAAFCQRPPSQEDKRESGRSPAVGRLEVVKARWRAFPEAGLRKEGVWLISVKHRSGWAPGA